MLRLRQLSAPAEWDPRWYQIGALLALLLYGWTALDFDLGVAQALVTVGAALGTQFLCVRGRAAFDPKSALISGLSLCLLLRTNYLALAAVTAVVAIGSKFLLRWHGKHLFNPTNFGLVVMMVLTDGRVWVSPGQWGSVAFFGFFVVCLGAWVVHRAARADVTLAFLAAYLGVLYGRSLWVSEPMTIPWHRFQSGALLLFAFFMISDPKTTPNSRAGRIVFAVLVALGAGFVQFKLFRANSLLWSLAVASLAVPVLDACLPGRRYAWKAVFPQARTPNLHRPDYEPVLT